MLLEQHGAAAARGWPSCAGLLHPASAAVQIRGEAVFLAVDAADSGGSGQPDGGGVDGRTSGREEEEHHSASLVVSDSPAARGVVEAEAVATSLWLHAVALLLQVRGVGIAALIMQVRWVGIAALIVQVRGVGIAALIMQVRGGGDSGPDHAGEGGWG